MTAWSIIENEDGTATIVHEGLAIGTIKCKIGWRRPNGHERREYVAYGRTVEVAEEHGLGDIVFDAGIASGGAKRETVEEGAAEEFVSRSTLDVEAFRG